MGHLCTVDMSDRTRLLLGVATWYISIYVILAGNGPPSFIAEFAETTLYMFNSNSTELNMTSGSAGYHSLLAIIVTIGVPCYILTQVVLMSCTRLLKGEVDDELSF